MLPGNSCETANTITLTRNSVTIASAKRLIRNRAIAGLRAPAPGRDGRGRSSRVNMSCQRGLAQVDLALRVRVVALDGLRSRGEVVVKVRDHGGGVVLQDRRHLRRELDLLLLGRRCEERL